MNLQLDKIPEIDAEGFLKQTVLFEPETNYRVKRRANA